MNFRQFRQLAHTVMAPAAPDVDHGDLVPAEQFSAGNGVAVQIGGLEADVLAVHGGHGINRYVKLSRFRPFGEDVADTGRIRPQILKRRPEHLGIHVVFSGIIIILRLLKSGHFDEKITIGFNLAQLRNFHALGKLAVELPTIKHPNDVIRIIRIRNDDTSQISDYARAQLLDHLLHFLTVGGIIVDQLLHQILAESVIFQSQHRHKWITAHDADL